MASAESTRVFAPIARVSTFVAGVALLLACAPARPPLTSLPEGTSSFEVHVVQKLFDDVTVDCTVRVSPRAAHVKMHSFETGGGDGNCTREIDGEKDLPASVATRLRTILGSDALSEPAQGPKEEVGDRDTMLTLTADGRTGVLHTKVDMWHLRKSAAAEVVHEMLRLVALAEIPDHGRCR
jgi:hypothetical protein